MCVVLILFIFIEIPLEAMTWISLVYLNLRKNLIEQLPVVVVKNWSKVSPFFSIFFKLIDINLDGKTLFKFESSS